MFWGKNRALEAAQNEKIKAGQRAMTNAALAAAQAADQIVARIRQLDPAPEPEEALLLCSLDGVITSCNEGAKAMFLDDMINQPVGRFLFCSETASIDTIWRSLTTGAVFQERNLIAVRGMRDHIPVNVTMSRIEKRDGQPTLLVLVQPIDSQASRRQRALSRVGTVATEPNAR